MESKLYEKIANASWGGTLPTTLSQARKLKMREEKKLKMIEENNTWGGARPTTISQARKNKMLEEKIEYFISYFADIAIIKRSRERLKEIQPTKIIEAETKADTILKLKKKVENCKKFYNEVLFYMSLADIYYLKKRFVSECTFKEVKANLKHLTHTEENKIIERYLKLIDKWLLSKTKAKAA